jgi:uncharacterized membrane protein HdeD (DUF308 family)
MAARALKLAAILLTALALVPAGAHLFALPNKIGLSEQDYFVVQGIYRGWALFGFVLIPAIIADLALAVILRRQRGAFAPALAGFLLIAASLVVFFAWTFPANQVTSNWTVVPENWQELRRQWEYAHAFGAVLTFAGLCCVSWASLKAPE